ncbi:MAG TPA: ABC transporter ATP-binding protein [Planctomycetaceae bacterium]|nr:ABC transporter ATP-binding protein [Planctomycetaceae bacterium]
MIIPAVEMTSSKRDLEAVAWLFEQLLLEAGRSADRTKVRRALEEAAEAWPMGTDDRWWKWLYETSRSLGIRCKVIDCTFSQMGELAREGAQIITCVGPERQWKAIDGTKGRQFHVLAPLLDKNRVWMSPGKLKDMLGICERNDLVRCLVIEPRLVGTDQDALDINERTPLRRILALLGAEWNDIWIILVFSAITGVLALATPLAVESLVSTVSFGRLLQPVIVVAIMLFMFLAFSAAIVGLQTYVVDIIQRRLFARILADLAYRLPRVEVAAVDGQDKRELVNRFFDIVTVQKACATLLLDGISMALYTVIGMLVLSFYHPWLLGYNVVLLAALAFVVFVLGRGAVYTATKESKWKYKSAAWLEDLAACPTTFRYQGAAEFALDRADRLAFEWINLRRDHFRILFRQIIFSLGTQAIASTVLLGIGGWLVISGQLTLGQLIAAELIVAVIVGSFAKLGKYMEVYYDLMAAIDKLGILFDLEIERQDGLLHFPSDGPASVVISELSYEGWPGQPGIAGLNMEILPGERLMLCGPSVGGKSHLLDLLFGLRCPKAGHLSINGVDPRDLRPDALRRSVALIRNVEIFHGTIAENVHLERSEVTTNDVRDALDQVGLLEEVLRLPNGLETELIHDGYPLTSDQARKLMLARGIAGQPCLLLIDGAVDALCDEDLEQVMSVLIEPSQPWTLVMATGRGDVAAVGTRTKLLGKDTTKRLAVSHLVASKSIDDPLIDGE